MIDMKQALLGQVLNLGNDDLVQSVGQGGNDSAIDYRGISNYIKTAKASHVITQGEIDQSYFEVPIIWDTPFSDANYTFKWTAQDGTIPPDLMDGDTHLVTSSGFIAVVLISAQPPTAGQVFYVHAIAIHD